MPLFGSKHNKNNDNLATGTAETTTGGGRHHHQNLNDGVANYPSAATGTGMGPGNNTTYPTDHQGQGMGSQGMGMPTGQQGYGGANLGQGQYGQGQQGQSGHGMTGQGFNNDNHGTGGLGAGSAPGAGGAGIPSTNTVNHGGNNTGGAGTRLTGKVESAIGSLVGSSALKAKGLQKEQETNAIKMQGDELAEAERLEREALMRRERAVGHGAHPANSQLGGGNLGGGGGGAGVGGGSGAY